MKIVYEKFISCYACGRYSNVNYTTKTTEQIKKCECGCVNRITFTKRDFSQKRVMKLC